jgi:type I restriction enzyme S subunit
MSASRYPKYRASGVEWLGDIPEHWKTSPLKAVSTHNDDVLDEAFPPDTIITYVDISSVDGIDGIREKEPMPFSAAPSRARRRVKDGDVIVSTVRTYLRAIAAVREPEENLIVSTGFAVIRPRTDVSPEFLGFALLGAYFLEQVISRSTGISYPAINASDLVAIQVVVPPRAEQNLIAAFLRRETAKTDMLVAEQRRLIELLKEKQQAVISHAVTKGLDPIVPTKPSGIEWLGDMPAHWGSHSLKHCAKVGAKTFTDGDWIEAPYITTEGVRLIQTGNVGIGRYKEQGFRFVSDETCKELQCTEVQPGDVLICRLDGPVGRACVVPDLGARMITSVDNAILKVADGVSAEFVVALLSSKPWLDWIDALCRVGGGFRLRVSRAQLGEIRVPIPPYDEQLAIARHVQARTHEAAALGAQAQRAIDLLQERRAALISAAVTGQIDVRGFVDLDVG